MSANIWFFFFPSREASGGLMVTFFGADGQQELDLRHFDDFIEALHVELVRLEYCHYDPSNVVG